MSLPCAWLGVDFQSPGRFTSQDGGRTVRRRGRAASGFLFRSGGERASRGLAFLLRARYRARSPVRRSHRPGGEYLRDAGFPGEPGRQPPPVLLVGARPRCPRIALPGLLLRSCDSPARRLRGSRRARRSAVREAPAGGGPAPRAVLRRGAARHPAGSRAGNAVRDRLRSAKVRSEADRDAAHSCAAGDEPARPQSAGDARSAHRPVQSPAARGKPAPRDSARAPRRSIGRHHGDRRRPFQAGQRHPRPRGGRLRAAENRRGTRQLRARGGYRVPRGRRGIRDHPSGSGKNRPALARRDSAPEDRAGADSGGGWNAQSHRFHRPRELSFLRRHREERAARRGCGALQGQGSGEKQGRYVHTERRTQYGRRRCLTVRLPNPFRTARRESFDAALRAFLNPSGDKQMSAGFRGRREDLRLLTGQGKYTSDWNLPGQLYGYFLRSDRAHAELASIDVKAAKGSPGVAAVFTGADTARAGFKSTPQIARYPGRGGATIKVPHRDGLANGRVRFVGQEVALVVASTALAAQDAAEKIEVGYRDLPAVVDAEEALAPGAEQLYPEIPGNL